MRWISGWALKTVLVGIICLILIPFILAGCSGSPMTSAKKFIEGLITCNQDTLQRYSTSEAREEMQSCLAVLEDSSGMSGDELWEEIRANSVFSLQSKSSDKASVLWEYEGKVKIRISLIVEKGIWMVDGMQGFSGLPMTSAKKFLEGLITGNQDTLRRYATAGAQEEVKSFSPILAIVKHTSGMSGDKLWDEILSKSVFTLQSQNSDKAAVLWEYEDIIKVRISLIVQDGIWIVDGWEGSEIPNGEESVD